MAGSPDTDTGGDDAVETAFLEIAAGIFPEELYSQIPGEERHSWV